MYLHEVQPDDVKHARCMSLFWVGVVLMSIGPGLGLAGMIARMSSAAAEYERAPAWTRVASTTGGLALVLGLAIAVGALVLSRREPTVSPQARP